MNKLSPTTEVTANLEIKPLHYPQMFGGGLFYLFAAAVASTFNSALALPFIAIAGAHLVTIVAVKLLHRHAPEQTKKFLLNAIHFKERYPQLQIVAFVIALIAAYIWGPLSCVFGILSGFYSGLLIKTGYTKDLQSHFIPSPQPLNAQIANN